MTPIPDPRSMNWLPSTSTTIAPCARSRKTGRADDTPTGTTALRRSVRASDFGPGIEVSTRRSGVIAVVMVESVYASGTPLRGRVRVAREPGDGHERVQGVR